MSYCGHESSPDWSRTKITLAVSAVLVIVVTGLTITLWLAVTSPHLEAEASAPAESIMRGRACQAFCQEMDAEGIYQTDCNLDDFRDCKYGHCTCVPDTLIEKLRVSGQPDFLPTEKPEKGPNRNSTGKLFTQPGQKDF